MRPHDDKAVVRKVPNRAVLWGRGKTLEGKIVVKR